MMKKNLLLAFLLSVAASAFAVEEEIGGLWYELVSKTKEAKVIKYKNDNYYSGDIVIPPTVAYDGVTYSVTSIGNRAFYGCSGLTSVTIGNSVTSIGDNAFYYCSGLTSVTIGNSVTSIGECAFEYCSGLTSITIPNSVTRIGNSAFYYCSGLTSVTIPNSVTSIGDYAFMDCSGLTSVTIGNGVTSIGYGTFFGCSGLTSVTIPGSVTSIGFKAFEDCTKLTSVHISDIAAWCNILFNTESGGLYYGPSSNPLTYAHHLFLNGEEIKDLVIPSSVTSIEGYAFYGCTGLTSVTIPNSVTSIGGSAFWGCSGLTSVHISDIAAWCEIAFNSNPFGYAHHLFLNGEEVKDLVIPNSVTSIGDWAFSSCSSLTSVTIPNSVTSIGKSAFSGCSGLTSVTIGNGIKTIGSTAFANCLELTDVYCYAENVPSTNSNAFAGSYIEYATLHVPTVALDAYKTTAPWSGFKEIVEIPGFALTYIVDGMVYKTYNMYEDDVITPEPAPTKEGYTFTGWSGLPEIMPAHDVTVTAMFTINKYNLTYMVDGEVYKSYEIKYGSTIIPEAEPTKEGYTFLGWSEIPEEMPAHDVTVTGTFTMDIIGKCATPTISYANRKLSFSSDTEGAAYTYEITDTDIKKGYDAEVNLTVAYTISVYATKAGYEDSNVATATLCWLDVEPSMGDITTQVAEVRANPVLITSEGGVLTLTGVPVGIYISVYNLSGQKVASATATAGVTHISTTLGNGEVAIVKIGSRSVKVMVK